VRFVGDHQVEIGWREELLVFVVEEQRLHGGDDDLGAPPIIAIFLIDDRLEIGGEQRDKCLFCLILQLEAVD